VNIDDKMLAACRNRNRRTFGAAGGDGAAHT
jgi:hypothetical protein